MCQRRLHRPTSTTWPRLTRRSNTEKRSFHRPSRWNKWLKTVTKLARQTFSLCSTRSDALTTCKGHTWTHCWRRRVLSQLWKRPWEFHLTRTWAVIGILMALALSACSKHASRGGDGAGVSAAVSDVTVAKV